MTALVRQGLDLEALDRWGAALGSWLVGQLSSARPTLTVGLVGDLGAGKTTLVRAVVGGLPGGDRRRVTSPTYAIVQPYPTRPPVRHADLYRLEGEDELEAIGYAEMMAEPGINLIEWIDKLPGAAPDDWLEIGLAALPGDVRDIRVRVRGIGLAPPLEMETCP